MSSRDINLEFEDNSERKYAYEFDWICRSYLLKRFSKYINSNVALELGAFDGSMTSQLLDYYDSVEIIEGSSDLCEILRYKFTSRVTVTNSLFSEIKNINNQKNIYLIHVLEHLDDPVAELKNIKNWLSEGGYLFIAVPNGNALSRQIAVHMGLIESNLAVSKGEYEHGHRRTYSLDTLMSDVRNSGLEIVEFGGVILKAFANFQFDLASNSGIIDEKYIQACDELAKKYPDFASSIYVVCKR